MIGALIERRANLFQTVELQDEIASLKAQIAGIVIPPPRPALHVVDRASPWRRVSARTALMAEAVGKRVLSARARTGASAPSSPSSR